MLSPDLIRHRAEFARALANHDYDLTPAGIVFPKQKALVSGAFITTINDRDMQVDPNIVPTEALNYLLQAGLKGTGALSAWYIAPFLNNVAPTAALTAANYETTLNEWIAYDEAARQAYTLPASPTGGVFSNSAAPAVFTSNAAATIYGAGILSASAKEATTGKIFCASLFAAGRVLAAADKLTVQYDVSATST